MLLDSMPMLAVLAKPYRIKQSHRRRRTIASGSLDYNYFRDYEPGTGRYVESDPISIEGGLNTYSYANANPLNLTDLEGLAAAIPLPVPNPWTWDIPLWARNPAGFCVFALTYSSGTASDDTCYGSNNEYKCKDNEDECEKEWQRARQVCRQLIYEQLQQAAGRKKKRSVRGVTGGYTDVEQCAKGLVSERCGGNKVVR